jgi:tetratricopeptide (TPR) repeat protein
VSFDPKITKIVPGLPAAPVTDARTNAPIAPKERSAQQLTTPDLEAARAASKQKEAVDRQMPRLDRGGASRLEQRFAELELALAKKNLARAEAAKSALAFCASYAARGSRGGRARALGLCALLEQMPEHEADAAGLRIGLLLDEAMHEGHRDDLLAGLTAAARLDVSADATVRAFVLAQGSQALAMLAEHFPSALAEVESPLEQAFGLAEEALSLAPELAEAHVALAQLVLLHGDHEAMRDAESLVRRALELEPHHDGATLTLATLAYCRHDPARALELLAELQSSRPQAQLLTARAQRATKTLPLAAATLSQAIQAFPELAALHVEAHVIAKLSKDDASAAHHRERAAELLGDAIDVDDAIALCFAGHSS